MFSADCYKEKGVIRGPGLHQVKRLEEVGYPRPGKLGEIGRVQDKSGWPLVA
jgi:hypothetical protein